MEQYIPKAPIVAEIDSIAADAICQYNSDKSRYAEGVIDVIHRIKHFLKTLEVADVDVIKRNWYNQGYLRGRREANISARELGLPSELDTLEVKDPYEQCVQYPTIKDGIKAHAETYSFNIESMLFNQLPKEQQELWRKEIEQAYISGGNSGVEFARDHRYKENLEVKEVDLEKELNDYGCHYDYVSLAGRKELMDFAKHFYELGLRTHIPVIYKPTGTDVYKLGLKAKKEE